MHTDQKLGRPKLREGAPRMRPFLRSGSPVPPCWIGGRGKGRGNCNKDQPPSPTIPSSSPTAPSKTVTAKPAGNASAPPSPTTPAQGSLCSWTWCPSNGTAASSCSSPMSRMRPKSSGGGGRRRGRGEGHRAAEKGVMAARGIRSFPAAPMRWATRIIERMSAHRVRAGKCAGPNTSPIDPDCVKTQRLL